MARSGVKDPLDKFRWTVSIPGFSKLGFYQCAVPRYNITPKEYAEAGSHLNPKVIIDRVGAVPVTLTRGVTNDTSFAKWAAGPWDLVQNNAASATPPTVPNTFEGAVNAVTNLIGASVVPASSSYPFSYRKDVKIEHVNRAGQAEVTYTLYNAIVISYQPASDFDAMADDALSIETLVLGYEGFDVRYAGVSGVLGNFLAGNLI